MRTTICTARRRRAGRRPITSRQRGGAPPPEHSKNTDAGNCAGDSCQNAMSQNAFASRSIARIDRGRFANCTRGSFLCPTRFGSAGASPWRLWHTPSRRTRRSDSIPNSCASARSFRSCACCSSRGGDDVWCVDTLRTGGLEALVPPLTARSAAQGDPRRAPGSRGVLSHRQARGIAGIRHADRRGLHRPEAPDRLRGSGQDPAGRHTAQGTDPHRLVEAPAQRGAAPVRGRRCAVLERDRGTPRASG